MRITRIFLSLGVMLLVFWSLAPLVWVVISSISPRVELYSIPPHWIPHNPTLANYETVLLSGATYRSAPVGSSTAQFFVRGLVNSIIIALATTAIVGILSTFAGYAFARLAFRGKGPLFLGMLMLLAIPLWSSLITLYSIFSTLGLLDTLAGLTIIYATYQVPLAVWLMRIFFERLPIELDEAARVDGASTLTVLTRVLFPIALPGLISVLIISFLTAWNNFLFPLIFSFTENSRPVTVVVSQFFGFEEVQFDYMSAAAVVAMVPPVVFTLFFQKYLVSGLSAGAVKG